MIEDLVGWGWRTLSRVQVEEMTLIRVARGDDEENVAKIPFQRMLPTAGGGREETTLVNFAHFSDRGALLWPRGECGTG